MHGHEFIYMYHVCDDLNTILWLAMLIKECVCGYIGK